MHITHIIDTVLVQLVLILGVGLSQEKIGGLMAQILAFKLSVWLNGMLWKLITGIYYTIFKVTNAAPAVPSKLRFCG